MHESPSLRRQCVENVYHPQGMEVGIMGDLIMSGALAHLDNIHVDWPKYRLSQEDSNKGEGETVDIRVDEKVDRFR